MNSLRRKLFTQIGLLVIVIVAVMILANSLFYAPFYHNVLKEKLSHYYDQIDSTSMLSIEERLTTFIEIESSSNVDILILEESEIIYTSNSYMLGERARTHAKVFEELSGEAFNPLLVKKEKARNPSKANELNKPPVKIEKVSNLNDKVSYYLASGDPLFGNRLLILSGTLSSGEVFELKVPFLSIQSNIDISNKFMIACGIVLFIIAMLYAYTLSRAFTNPILEINRVTKEMKNLKFDQFCKVGSSNELGQLATSINELSASLSNAISELNRKNYQLEELINSVSHELKTPLALVQGYAEGIELNIAKDEAKTKFYTDVIIDEAKKMNRIVDTLLNIRSYENGEKEKFRKDFDIAKLIDRVINKFEPLLEKEALEIIYTPIDETKVSGDAFDVEQILINYISNALSHVDQNKEIEIYLERNEIKTRIFIYNSCFAFDAFDVELVWNKFTKRDSARNREKGGHGLGLSIVKAIQESNSLDCGVENSRNGVVFWFDVLNA